MGERNTKMMVSVVLPAYKEADNLQSILPRLHTVLEDIPHEILVIDTVEPMDDTQSVCSDCQARYVRRRGGNNYGDAIRTGFEEAKGDLTVVMDADGSHDPDDILRFYREMISKDCDLVIGSRYCKGGHTDNNFILRLMSWMLNVTYRLLFGLKVKDVSNSFRMYISSQVKELKLECSNFDVVEEILIKLVMSEKRFDIKEIPISFRKREKGESKRDLMRFILTYLQTIIKLSRIKRGAI